MGYEDVNPHKKLYLAYRHRAILPFLRYSWPGCELLPPPRLWLTLIGKAAMMIKKKILNPDRIRHIDGGFSFIPHRFICDGFLAALQQKELLLYLFLVIVSDRHGLSFYSYDAICTLLQMSLDQYITARNGLMDKDLIAFDGTLFQVLDLPQNRPRQQKSKDRSPVEQLIQQTVKAI